MIPAGIGTGSPALTFGLACASEREGLAALGVTCQAFPPSCRAKATRSARGSARSNKEETGFSLVRADLTFSAIRLVRAERHWSSNSRHSRRQRLMAVERLDCPLDDANVHLLFAEADEAARKLGAQHRPMLAEHVGPRPAVEDVHPAAVERMGIVDVQVQTQPGVLHHLEHLRRDV